MHSSILDLQTCTGTFDKLLRRSQFFPVERGSSQRIVTMLATWSYASYRAPVES